MRAWVLLTSCCCFLARPVKTHNKNVTILKQSVRNDHSHVQAANGQLRNVEWPVFFEKLGHVHSIHNKFDLALRVHINVPAVEQRIGKVIKKLKILDADIKGRMRWRKSWSCLLNFIFLNFSQNQV